MEINALIIRSIEAQANSLLDLAHRDSNDYQRAVELILGMSGKLVFTGMGKSGIIARKLAATFSSTGVPSFFVHPGEAYHGDLGMIEVNDVLFALSNSGETPELLNLLKYSRSKKVIGVSHSNDSSLASFATVHLECKVDKEVCPLNLAPTTSTTAALVMGCPSIHFSPEAEPSPFIYELNDEATRIAFPLMPRTSLDEGVRQSLIYFRGLFDRLMNPQ